MANHRSPYVLEGVPFIELSSDSDKEGPNPWTRYHQLMFERLKCLEAISESRTAPTKPKSSRKALARWMKGMKCIVSRSNFPCAFADMDKPRQSSKPSAPLPTQDPSIPYGMADVKSTITKSNIKRIVNEYAVERGFKPLSEDFNFKKGLFPWRLTQKPRVWVSSSCLASQPPTSAKMPSHKSFMIKKKLAKKMRQNRPIPHWIRLRTDNTIRYNAKRRHWRRTKLGF
ncbi:hypothetical protein F8388_000760 [Cannabis sativa]|uniref:60S ribosomal protein L39 n=1 Tax=Cannabis sativa TaxID=3483 RepID=A0A7J6DYP0_CANSA|nr:hypothetical protein F8388_000760 [Cannabis sativa]